MKSILLIGIHSFGSLLAKHFSKQGHEVMAIDREESRINEILPYVTDAQIGDSTNEKFLRTLGINNYDICIVTIGGDFQSSLETTSLLKELGGKLVVSRADRDVQTKFLLRNGADEVLNPENRLLNGRQYVMVPIIYLIILSLMMSMRFLRFLYQRTGQKEVLVR